MRSSTRCRRSSDTARCAHHGCKKVLAIATAACRDAKNGRAFIKLAERTIGAPTSRCCPARREAELTALGVISGVHRADGIVGDLGGGSLELVDVHGTRARHGADPAARRPRARRTSRRNRSRRRKNSSRRRSAALPVLKDCEDRNFYAVGGTWRALARLHMWQTGYPLHVMHGYAIPRRRGAGIRQAGAPGRRRNACRISRWSTSARRPLLALCGAGAGKYLAHRQAAAGDVLRARRARRAALFAAQAARTRKRTR